jgi:hypothetical protein
MNSDPNSKPEEAENEPDKPPEGLTPQCTCVQDPFAVLPPELRPHQRSWKDGLRKVTCPGCGFQYWTNCKTDLCIECEKKGVKLPEPESKTGGG